MITNDNDYFPHLALPHQLCLILQLSPIFVGVLVLVPANVYFISPLEIQRLSSTDQQLTTLFSAT